MSIFFTHTYIQSDYKWLYTIIFNANFFSTVLSFFLIPAWIYWVTKKNALPGKPNLLNYYLLLKKLVIYYAFTQFNNFGYSSEHASNEMGICVLWQTSHSKLFAPLRSCTKIIGSCSSEPTFLPTIFHTCTIAYRSGYRVGQEKVGLYWLLLCTVELSVHQTSPSESHCKAKILLPYFSFKHRPRVSALWTLSWGK